MKRRDYYKPKSVEQTVERNKNKKVNKLPIFY